MLLVKQYFWNFLKKSLENTLTEIRLHLKLRDTKTDDANRSTDDFFFMFYVWTLFIKVIVKILDNHNMSVIIVYSYT